MWIMMGRHEPPMRNQGRVQQIEVELVYIPLARTRDHIKQQHEKYNIGMGAIDDKHILNV